jgi:hypothetical protein
VPDEVVAVKDLIKLAPLAQKLPWPKLGFVLVLGLLLRQVVNFEQSVILILLAMVIDKFSSPRHRGVTTGRAGTEKEGKDRR